MAMHLSGPPDPTSAADLAKTCDLQDLTTRDHNDPSVHDANVGHIASVRGIPVLRLTGELDLLAHPQLERMLNSLTAGPALTVVVDTSAVTFIDCTGLAPLIRAAAALSRRQARLFMLQPSAPVLLLAALTGTSELLDLTFAHAAPRV